MCIRDSNGECPPKVTINLWAVECIRNEGTMEAQALSLLGVRPVYNAISSRTLQKLRDEQGIAYTVIGGKFCLLYTSRCV